MRVEQALLLSSLPATRRHKSAAALVAVGLLIGFLITLPFMSEQLPREDSFIPIIDTTLFLVDLITAALLYAQFAVARARALLALASGYLFTALIIVPHLLTFPGALAPTGLFGAGLQSTVWLYIFWHLGLPCASLAYVLLKGHPREQPDRGSAAPAIMASIAAIALAVILLTWLVTTYAEWLPAIMIDFSRANSIWEHVAAPPLILLSLTAIVVVWRQRSSVLDLWLLVVLWAWFIETGLLSLTASRFSLVWYAGRVFGLLSSSLVLLVFLSEVTVLYARLALSVTNERRGREGQRMTLDVVLSSLAHELHQPLTVILANDEACARFLNREPPDLAEVRLSLEDIAAATMQASQTINSLRSMFKDHVQPMMLLNVEQLVEDALKLLRIELQTAGISVELERQAGTARIMGNRTQLLQTLLNLISNAIESMVVISSRPRVLHIQIAMPAEREVLIRVRDTGGGIDPADLQRIFDLRFTTKPSGTGLGLAICQSIVEAHGGSISAANGTPHGAVLSVALPAQP